MELATPKRYFYEFYQRNIAFSRSQRFCENINTKYILKFKVE